MVAVLLAMAAPGPLAAQPTIVPDMERMRLDEVGLYRIGYAYRGQPERDLPPGWSGGFEDATGAACEPAGTQRGRAAFLLHCPWRGGTGVTFQEYLFRVPAEARRVTLTGATAMREEGTERSDGVTFRILANGARLLDVHRKDSRWVPFRFDLSRFRGRTLKLRFEVDPGPADDPSFDFSLWGDRELRLEGLRPRPVRHPAPPPLDLRRLRSASNGSVAPLSGFTGTRQTQLRGDLALLRYSGADGTLEFRWRRPGSAADPPFGRITLHARPRGGQSVEVPLATDARLAWTGEASPVSSSWALRQGSVRLTRAYRVGGETASLSVTGRLVGKSLVLEARCDRPLAQRLDAGGWGPVLRRRRIPVPYYSGAVHYLPREGLFTSAFLDWTASSASSHDGARAHYAPLTDGRRNPLRERAVYTAAWHLAEVLPNIPNPPSPYRKQVAGRVVLDTWGGGFADIAGTLRRLAEYGIDRSVVLVHVWQRSGYDNALPAHLPANPGLGGDEAMKQLVSTARTIGHLIGLHENYVDYYPNFEGFTESDIALNPDGTRVRAWYNPGTRIQSFAVKPTAILRLAETQSPEIHRRFGTNACFLDVHSAVPPWFHVDARAGEAGAGTFRQVWDVHRALWRYERRVHGGPVFGEGNNHWYWSGYLDGAEAQFGVGWPANQGMTAPLMVDFDLLRIHPLQVNHGMGYLERWYGRPEWGGLPPLVVLDQYRMQEVIYGHAGFLGSAVWSVLPLAWLEHHLLSPVTERYGASLPVEIRYQVAGRWVDGTAAAKAGQWRRARVRYASGLTVTANDAPEPLRVGGHLLPRFGWLAAGAGVTAYTALRNGVVADYAETARSVFANARNADHWNVTGVRRVKPEVAEFRQTGPRAFSATYRWRVGQPLDGDYHCFVHFGRPGQESYDEGIRFQQDHALPKPTSRWTRGEVVVDGPHSAALPGDLPDGDYEWVIGLHTPGGGRLTIEGPTDRHGRVLLGVLRVAESGRRLTFLPEKRAGDARLEWYRRHLNEAAKVVDFGTVRTNGSVSIRREGSDWVLRALPREQPFTLELSTKRFPVPSEVRSEGGSARRVIPERRGAWWRLRLNGARDYRWSAGAASAAAPARSVPRA